MWKYNSASEMCGDVFMSICIVFRQCHTCVFSATAVAKAVSELLVPAVLARYKFLIK